MQYSSTPLSVEWNTGDEDVFKVLPCIENYALEVEGLGFLCHGSRRRLRYQRLCTR